MVQDPPRQEVDPLHRGLGDHDDRSRSRTILVVYGFHIISGILAATLFGNVVAIVPSYYLTRAWAWGKRGRSHWRKEVLPYWLMSFAGIAFSLLGATWVKQIVHSLRPRPLGRHVARRRA